MNNSMNYNYPVPANYSGVTINITNPALNMPSAQPQQNSCYCTQPNCTPNNLNPMVQVPQNVQNQVPANNYGYPVFVNPADTTPAQVINPAPQAVQPNYQNTTETAANLNQTPNQAYPSNYYLNNYNYIQDPKTVDTPVGPTPTQTATVPQATEKATEKANVTAPENYNTVSDTNTSKEIIDELDARNSEEKELEKSGTKTKVTALTNEYIMSLENYLNNPNTDIRLMAAKEILKRLDEDRSRYNDAALNALLNKMLQDPNKLIRIAALSALSSELASGNDYTVELLQKIQQNPDADPQDVLEASQILLKRTTETEVRYVPNKTTAPAENKA